MGEAAEPKVLYCKYKDKRLEQDEEWHRTGVNQSWQVWKWDHIQDELKLTAKKPQPMCPLISPTEPFAIMAEMVNKNVPDKQKDNRLAETEIWHHNQQGWNICVRVHGIHWPTGRKVKPAHPILNIGAESDTDTEEQDVGVVRAESPGRGEGMTTTEQTLAFEISINRLKWDTNTGKYKCNLCNHAKQWDIEEAFKAICHVTRAHDSLSSRQQMFCPYCPKELCEKKTMSIHLKLRAQGNKKFGKKNFTTAICPCIPQKTPEQIWDDLLEKNGKPIPGKNS